MLDVSIKPRLVSLVDFCTGNPQFKISTLRGMIFRNHRNIRRCLVRLGRKVLLDVDAFEAWLLENRERD